MARAQPKSKARSKATSKAGKGAAKSRAERAAKAPAAKRNAAPARKTAKKAPGGTRRKPASKGVKVRMYRQGLGDCFLLTFPGKGGKPYYVVIDCGVILGTQNAGATIGKVVQSIIDTTGGKIDLLAATHEHWDHVSGFVQAKDLWQKNLQIDEIWMAWTENPKDSQAKKMKNEHMKMCAALRAAAPRMRMAGDAEAAADVASMVEFFGAAGGNSTAAAMEIIRELAPNVRYCDPADAPIQLGQTGIKAYVLGPPRDEKLIRKINPSTKVPETYGVAAMHGFLDHIAAALTDPAPDGVFDAAFHVPLEAARQVSFFQTHYWGEDADSEEKNQDWRRIDGSWLDSSAAMALALDSATNNTSLVLAFELDGGDVLLFAADAQVGNWLSWHDLSWTVGGKKVTGPDLLNRAIFYKVGHHGSHNATLREQGLEEMKGLKLAFLPVDQEMAKKKRWGQMPFNDLTKRLDELTKNNVVRIDQDIPKQLKKQVTADPGKDKLYYEVEF